MAVETALAAGALFVIDAFAWRKLTVAGFALAVAGWLVALLTDRLIRHSAGSRPGLTFALEVGIPALWLALGNAALKQPWTMGQIVYASLFVAVVWRVWRWLLGRAERDGNDRHAEALRLGVVGAGAAAAVAPFFTDLQVGGTDARWYTGVFIDFVQQLRAGVFPVFVGQGEFSFNGSVNLFRTAPLCLWLGGVWDWLTAQSLSPVAIRNLAVVTAAFAAAFSMYVVLRRLSRPAPGAPAPAGWTAWSAALLALLYLLCPGVIFLLYFYELQMSFTALLALPWIFYGNVRTLRDDDGRGYIPLAVGLTLAWLAHAPLAIISVLATAALQAGRFLFEPAALKQWKAAAGGAVLFVLLSAYYFLSMSDLPSMVGPGLRREAAFVLGLGLAVTGPVVLFHHCRWSGLVPWLLGAALAWVTLPAWTVWVLAWGLVYGGVVLLLRRLGATVSGARSILLAAVAMLAALFLAESWARARGLGSNDEEMQIFARNVAGRAELFQVLAPKLTKYTALQPGFALWGLAALVLVAAWWRRSVALALLASLAGFLIVLVLSVPRAGEFLIARGPEQLESLVNLPLLYRVVPPLAALTVIATGLVLAGRPSRSTGWSAGATILLALGTLWSGWEVRLVLANSGWMVASRGATAQAFSPDRFSLGRYPYLMLKIPPYFNDGKQAYWLESRLLNARQDVVVGPQQLAARAEEFNSDELVLTSRVDPTYPIWLNFEPKWDVQPGESLLLRFEFPTDRNCSGWLILRGDRGGYQEHYLNPSYLQEGFGVGAHASSVLAVTNSGPHIEHYEMVMQVDAGNTLPRDGGPWAKLHISRYHAEDAPVRVESLLPYRAHLRAPGPGFLETPRQWLPGYAATVDARPVAAVRSRNGLVAVPVAAGDHDVTLAYRGTAKLRAGLLLSGVTWAALAAAWLFAGTGGPAAWWRKFKTEFSPWIDANRN